VGGGGVGRGQPLKASWTALVDILIKSASKLSNTVHYTNIKFMGTTICSNTKFLLFLNKKP
jgi:hypothetical protein